MTGLSVQLKPVLGILLDTKHIMQTYTRHNGIEILNMSQMILNSIHPLFLLGISVEIKKTSIRVWFLTDAFVLACLLV